MLEAFHTGFDSTCTHNPVVPIVWWTALLRQVVGMLSFAAARLGGVKAELMLKFYFFTQTAHV